LKLSPSVHKFGYEHIYSGLSAALGHELGPNGVSIYSDPAPENTSLYLRIEALRKNNLSNQNGEDLSQIIREKGTIVKEKIVPDAFRLWDG